jgi:pimeloyl-ACP methyl ester carboxylesterase
VKRLPNVVPPRAPLSLLLAFAAVLAAVLGLGTARADATPARLFTDCRGERTASPLVILESGAFGTAADWDLVLDDLARGGRVCAYDRGGLGASPPRAGGEDVIAIAHELADLLDGMGERGPVILVGHSNGALYIETFAALWPQRVAGLVYVNGVTSDDLDHPALLADLAQERFLANLAAGVGALGLAPAVAHILADGVGLTGEAGRRKREALNTAEKLRVARDEDRAVIAGLMTARRLGGSPPANPTAVIWGATDPNVFLAKAWREAEAAPAARAKRSWVLNAVGATHTSPLVRDRAYVAAAVRWLRSLPAGPKP